ncbi:hypothetical protein ABZ454_36330 [Streptomyces sp. NPDC005803]|uniref:hypothetical protein n=1 Tax=Streptomyces sp. NPDC005803 TaxID=3154297 RepID=UPI0033E335FF
MPTAVRIRPLLPVPGWLRGRSCYGRHAEKAIFHRHRALLTDASRTLSTAHHTKSRGCGIERAQDDVRERHVVADTLGLLA